jgi:fermentation-respiration switch protein FrsA (DUF1100 family)
MKRGRIPVLTVLFILLPGSLLAAEGQAVQLDTGTGVLHGTLLLPGSQGPWPVALILSGSGPTDRDGNSALFPGKNNCLRQLAHGLAERGIASLRYDKRGIAASSSAGLAEQDMRFEHFIDDAAAWCRFLQGDGRFNSLTVVGHSEGAQIGASAAWLAGADGLVSVAGPGRDVFALLREQLGDQLAVRGRIKAEEIMSSLEQGQLVDDPPQELAILFRRSVQPYLMSWARHDPQQELARFDGPISIVQGTTDTQVKVEDAELLAAAVPRARLVLLEGLNHVLKPVAGTAPVTHQMSLFDSTLVVGPEAVEAVADLCAEAGEYRRQKAAVMPRLVAANGTRVPGRDDASSLFAEAAALPTAGRRAGFWARRFLDQGAGYRFGLAEGGYADQGLLVMDDAVDCVSFMYRCTELARSRSADEALLWALRTRFPGAPLDTLVGVPGRVDYDRPEHLDFSLDMVRAGIWGQDITGRLHGAVADTVGSSRYPANSFRYVAKAELRADQLAEGDVVWLVLDPGHEGARRLRQEHGLVIGHLGLIIKEAGETWLVHAASSALEGHYDEPGVVKVPLQAYLQEVPRFAGVIVTRL